jgi:hypothetical protein
MKKYILYQDTQTEREYTFINNKNEIVTALYFNGKEDFYKEILFNLEYLKKRGLSLNNLVYIHNLDKLLIEKTTLKEIIFKILNDYEVTLKRYPLKLSKHNYKKIKLWVNRYKKLSEVLK